MIKLATLSAIFHKPRFRASLASRLYSYWREKINGISLLAKKT
jgi:hypothetical protein